MKWKIWNKLWSCMLSCLMAFATAFSVGACVLGNGGDSSSASDTPAGFTELTYIAFGDSITWGEDGETHEQMKKPYPQLVAESLQLKNVENYGKRGATVTYVTTNKVVMGLVEEAPSKANIVSVMIGVNDFAGSQQLGTLNDTGYNTIYGSLNNLVVQIQNKYKDAFIFFMTPLKQYKSAEINSAGYKLSDVANAVKEVCATREIPVLDLYETGEYSMQTDPNSDGLHPTQKFVANYTAPKITQFIQEHYGA